MTLNHLKEAARKHIDQTAKDNYSPACLSELDAALLHSHNHISLESLESWLDPATDKKSLSVSCCFRTVYLCQAHVKLSAPPTASGDRISSSKFQAE